MFIAPSVANAMQGNRPVRTTYAPASGCSCTGAGDSGVSAGEPWMWGLLLLGVGVAGLFAVGVPLLAGAMGITAATARR